MKNPYILVAVSVVASVVLAAFFIKPVQNVVNQVPGVNLGSITGPDSLYPFSSVNGLVTWSNRAPLRQASTTVCSFRSPTSGTSTLAYGGINFVTSSTSAMIVEMGQAATPYATTTKIGGTLTVSASGQAAFTASTTPSGSAAAGNLVFAPGTYFNIKAQGGVTGGEAASASASAGFVPTGSCGAEFIAL